MADPINNPCVAGTTLGAPEGVRVQPQGAILLVASCTRTGCVQRGNLSAGSRAPQLRFSLLVVGLSLALRDAQGLAPAVKNRSWVFLLIY